MSAEGNEISPMVVFNPDIYWVILEYSSKYISHSATELTNKDTREYICGSCVHKTC